MSRQAFGITGSQWATLCLAIVLGAGLAGCKSSGKKTDTPAASVAVASTAASSSTDTSSTGSTGTTGTTGATGATGTTGTTGTTVTTGATVAAAPDNNAPTLSGSPVTTAKTTLPYSFQPFASDADGDPLTFEIRNKPAWATFDAFTGRLEGTPPAGSIGALPVVQIIVSDGKASATMDLSINVIEPTVGSATLEWKQPTVYADGTPLYNLAGYVIRYGRAADALDQSLRINDAAITSAVVESLIEGTWYFSLSAITSDGTESDPAGPASKTIG